eukprot:2412974-Rhodomonas_salina.2
MTYTAATRSPVLTCGMVLPGALLSARPRTPGVRRYSPLVLAYARPTQCPVLTLRIALPAVVSKEEAIADL